MNEKLGISFQGLKNGHRNDITHTEIDFSSSEGKPLVGGVLAGRLYPTG